MYCVVYFNEEESIRSSRGSKTFNFLEEGRGRGKEWGKKIDRFSNHKCGACEASNRSDKSMIQRSLVVE